MKVRETTENDNAAVLRIVEAAFGQELEADLVSELKKSGNAVIDLVAEANGEIVGHILFSRLQSPNRCIALAPVSVAPDHRRQGVGSALIRNGLKRAKAEEWVAVFLVGEPEYYSRFGFDVAKAAKFETEYPKPYFMVLELAEGALGWLDDKVVFATPFLDLE